MSMTTRPKSFIETQFPVSKISKESYKERKANYSQTLTGLGKWWGRKPLILVRAAILGLLIPSTDDPKKDRDVFLKLLTMDEEGLWQRKSKNISLKDLYARLSTLERERWFDPDSTEEKPKYKKRITSEERKKLQHLVFMRLSYDEKLTYCNRPEQIDGPSPEAWEEINAHLGTPAQSLPEFVRELGKRRFGHTPRVGDAFCGGGNIPFEAARIGCEAYGSDLNPVAALLTWASLNIVGGGKEVVEKVRKAQETVYAAVDRQITEWGIEHNEKGWRADAYLYCVETRCPECGVMVPMAPSWVIGEKTRTVARLELNDKEKRFNIRIESGVSDEIMVEAKNTVTVKGNALHCPACEKSTPITMIRGDRRGENSTKYGLRMWENEDVVPRPEDVFQERLYCIRWVETLYDEEGKAYHLRYYMAPDENDLNREAKVLGLLRERFHEWQKKGCIPNRRIEPGDKTDEPIRTRGWTHWHHLFNARQLILLGHLLECSDISGLDERERVGCMLAIGKLSEYTSKLSRYRSSVNNEARTESAYYNQALNTLYNYGVRPSIRISEIFDSEYKAANVYSNFVIETEDARHVTKEVDIWVTDPPYADAINYHELSEYFIAWYEKTLIKLFPDWYTDSKRALAITGSDETFRRSMVDSYYNLAARMPDDGMQIVMFTHQNASVWADLALILWAAGLRVTAAWTIATETESALKQGNYVQGTVLLILRKQTSDITTFLSDLPVQVEDEVKDQLDSMLALDDQEDPNFGDTDYQLAAYAAALRVLTQYKGIEDFDIAHELSKRRINGEKSSIELIIEDAVKIACDHLVPKGFDTYLWKTLTPEERLYLKGLDLESHGEFRAGAYQELARGFGVREYTLFFAKNKANQTRFKTAREFSTKALGGEGFGSSLVRNALFAVREAVRTEEAQTGKNWLRNEFNGYWDQRKNLIKVLNYLGAMEYRSGHWNEDATAARLVSGAVENDHA